MSSPSGAKAGNGGPNPPETVSAPPERIANVPAPAPLMDMNSIFLQSIMETQKAVAELGAKTDRLIADVGKQSEKIEGIRGQINFFKGAAWIIGGILAAALALGVAVYNKSASTSVPTTAPPPLNQAPPSVSRTPR